MPIRDLRAKRMRLDKLNEFIPEWERSLMRAIQERASLEAIIVKIEAHDLGKKHNGLCNEIEPACGNCLGVDPDSCMGDHDKCERFYGHTGLHSWEGGGHG